MSFDLSSGSGLPPSIQYHSPLFIAVQITDCYWSEESLLLLIGFHYRDIETERRVQSSERVCTVLFLAQKSNQNTWFSATLVFSLVFRWFSAVSPTLCTVISKKHKLSCFGGFFPLVFKIQATAWFSWSFLHAAIRPNGNITFYLYLFKVYLAKKIFEHFSDSEIQFLQTNKQSPPPPSSPYITHKIRQICFIYKGRKPRNKKTKGAADNQRNARLCKAESRKPGFLDNKSSVHAPSGQIHLFNS
jgi:hypothetical protein